MAAYRQLTMFRNAEYMSKKIEPISIKYIVFNPAVTAEDDFADI